MSMDESERALFTDSNGAEERSAARPPALPSRDSVRLSVSPNDVHLGDHHDNLANGHHSSTASPDFRLSHPDSDDGHSSVGHGPSPFSPDADTINHNFLDAQRRRSAHDTIHERGESQLSNSDMHMMDSAFLGTSSAGLHQPHVLSLNHTGLSAYSDGGDPFGSAMSPQATGGRFDESEVETDEEEERTGLTSGSLIDSTGERRAAPETGASWRGLKLNGGGGNGTGSVSQRGPPPPIPSSASFLSKSKARLAPPPPPLPSRNSH